MSQQQKWTPEPWIVNDERDIWHGMGPGGQIGVFQDSADSQRAVACVNAMANVPDPAAFVAAVDAVLRTCASEFTPTKLWLVVDALRLARGEVKP